MTDDLSRRLAKLSPAKRRLYERKIREREEAAARRELRPLEPDSGPFELSFAQERFWFMEQLEPGNPAHHIPSTSRIRGTLDTRAFQAAVNALVERHEILRTTFVMSDERPVQVVAPSSQLSISEIDLRALDAQDRERERQRLVERQVLAPFDLHQGPLIRMRLLQLADEEWELVTCLHHIVADGLSVQILAQDLATLYASQLEHARADLPRLPVQYRDYAAWQRTWLRGATLLRESDFWIEQLRDLPMIELPFDRPRDPELPPLGARVTRELDRHLVERLEEIGRQEDATLFMVVLAAFNVFLHRLSGSSDVAVGTPVANRTHEHLAPLVGFFVNSLVLRTDLSGEPTFRELLQRVRRISLDAQNHQEFPFEKLVDVMRPERHLDRNPLFQVMLVLVDFIDFSQELPGLTMAHERAQAGTLLDLTLYLVLGTDTASIEFEYDTRLFDEETMRLFLGHLATLLEAIAADPGSPIGCLPLLDSDDLALIESFSSGPSRPAGAVRCIHQLFDRQADRTPAARAVRSEETCHSYSELQERSRHLAAGLRREGVGTGDRVGIAAGRHSDLVAALLAVSRVGAAYVPLDPSLPTERLAFMVADAGCTLVITEQRFRDRIAETDARPICLDTDTHATAIDTRTESVEADDPAACFYVAYTSGSTGRPKGVAVPQRAVVNLLESMAREPGLSDTDTLCAVTTISFDISVLEIFGPLLAGGTVLLASESASQDGLALGKLLEDPSITVMQATPSTWRMLRLSGWQGRDDLCIWSGGEPLPEDLAAELLACGSEVWNLYGPTETTIWSTAFRVREGRVCIGRPVQETATLVVDTHLAPVPIGVAGELLIGGAGVADGYVGRPDLDRERFIPDPLSEDAGARVYRTGDLARWNRDGTLDCLGRLDSQVKIRGHRVELEEIETVLREHARVADCAVDLQENLSGDPRLVAWVAPRAPSDLRTWLEQKLPPVMIPSTFVSVPALPRTHGGKLDRKALPRDVPAEPARRGDPARTQTERELARMWCDLLGLERVSTQDDFFALGGHSLLATRLASRIRASLGLEMPLRRFFAAPTLEALAREIDETDRPEHPEDRLPLTCRAPGASLPLSFAQQRLHFLEQLQPGTATYNLPVAVRLEGRLDEEALRRSLEEIIHRHEALRTVFQEVNDEPVQTLMPPGRFDFERAEVGSLAASQPKERLRALMEEVAHRPFDLTRGPLIRGLLVSLGASDHVLVVSQHHIVSDGWSLGVMVREMRTLYGDFKSGLPPSLAPPSLQYGDFTLWQQELLRQGHFAEHLAWWRDHLATAPPALELPFGKPRPSVQAHRGASLSFTIPAELSASLRKLAQELDATLFITLLSAFKTLLHRLTGETDIVVGTSIANRSRVETEDAVGFFVNTLALRSDLESAPRFSNLVARIRDTTIEAHARQDLPFEKLVEDLNPVRDLAHSPLFQVAFDLLNVPIGPLDLEGLRTTVMDLHTRTSKFDLSVRIIDDPELLATVEFDTDLFSERTVRRWWTHYETLLDAIVRTPHAPITKLRVLSEPQRQDLLVRCNATASAYASEACLHDLFRQQVQRTPEGIAASCGNDHLTYEQLDASANRLARHLQGLGVGPETPVGICTDRSLHLITGVLGVLAAGGAYVPLDPRFPAERLRFMLEDAGARIVLADAVGKAALPATDVTLIELERVFDSLDTESASAPACAATAANLANVIYTSGSTGQPKGVLVSHLSLVNYTTWAARTYRFQDGRGTPLHSSIAFDFTITSLFPPLICGGHVLLIPGDDSLADLVRSLGTSPDFSVVKLTPSVLDALAREAGSANLERWAHTLVLGGEALDSRSLEFWRGRAPKLRIFNEYGPTEATVGCCVHEIRSSDSLSGPVSIGRPIANTSLYVLDEHKLPVLPGSPGELYIGGDGLARGYLNRDDLGTERFVPDPFTEDASSRLLYRTGDRVRHRSDGSLEFLGRLDDQLKIRGFRIEPAEIEAHLRALPAVRDCSVAGRTRNTGSIMLVAWVEMIPDARASDLRAALLERLPDAMVPGVFVPVDSLPRTVQGKLDQAALPEPGREAPSPARPHALPRNATEAFLVECWQEVLDIESVGIHDNFFALGGDSILSLRIVARARQAGLDLSTRHLFEHQTIAALTDVVGAGTVVLAEQGLVTGAVPLAPIQRWFFEHVRKHPEHWNQSLVFDVRRDTDAGTLEQAFTALVNHHDALRMRFVKRGPVYEQHGAASAPGFWRHVDLSREAPERHGEVIRGIFADAQATLDLEHGPLMRTVLVERGAENPALLLWTIHHLVVDAVSWHILHADLEKACQDITAGRAVALPRKTTPFRDWARHVETAGFSAPMPVRQAAAGTEGEARVVRVALDTGDTEALVSQTAAARQAPVQTLLLAALGCSLAQWSGDQAIRIDLEGHGRPDPNQEFDVGRTVGWFTGFQTIRLESVPGETPEAVLEMTERRLHASPAAALSSDGPAVLFNYLGLVDRGLSRNAVLRPVSIDAGPHRSPGAPRSHELEIEARVFGGRLLVEWRYHGALHSEQDIVSVAEGHLAHVRRLVGHCLAGCAGTLAPDHFPLAHLDQESLDRIIADDEQVQDIVPLSSTQQGMFFHSLYAPGSTAYFEQLCTTFRGDLDAAALHRAFDEVVGRHDLFRARIAWKGLAEPLLVIRSEADLPWDFQDWSDLSRRTQEEHLEALLARDREQGFDFEVAPLVRCTLLGRGEARHTMVFSYHHVVLDGWSMPVLLDEILKRYEGHRYGRAHTLEPAPPYRDYIARLALQDGPAARRFFRDELEGFDIPTDMGILSAPASSDANNDAFDEREVRVDQELSTQLRALGRHHGLTLNTIVQGAWSLLLARLGGEEDVVFGATVSGRPADLPGIEERVGLFINTLPIRVRVRPDAVTCEFLEGLQERQLQRMQHELTPLTVSQACSDVPAGRQLFESLLVFENYPLGDVLESGTAGLDIEEVRSYERTSYPLTVVAVPGEYLVLRVIFDTGRLAGPAAERLLAWLRTILHGFASAPHARLADVRVTTQDERRRLLGEWATTEAPHDAPGLVHEQIQEQALRAPDACALAFGDQTLSYGELNTRVEDLAGRLRARGTGPGDVVGLCLERSPELIVGLLGILEAGAAYLPLVPDQPPDRLAFMARDAEAALVVTLARWREHLVGCGAELLDFETSEPSPPPPDVQSARPGPGDAAYVMYTSGSTGKPKGVVIEHRSLAHYVSAARRAFDLGLQDRVLQFASLGFDTSAEEIFTCLAAGGTLDIRSDDMLASPRGFLEICARRGITVLDLPTAWWHELVAGLEHAPVELPPDLRLVIIGGEAAHPDRVTAWHRLPGHAVRLVNTYGPTEATIVSTMHELADPGTSSAPIGRPIPGAEVFVLDARRQPSPQGAAGELYIGGAGLARGYLNQPALTAERFVPHPFTDAPGRRLYRTGDRVRFNEDGVLEFLSRMDLQLKMSGVRIEPGEVEAALTSLPHITAAVVVARSHGSRRPGQRMLVAYVVPKPGTDVDPDLLRRHCARHLPETMVPARFVALDHLPLSRHGKLDRQALPEPGRTRPEASSPYASPRTAEERAFAELLGDLLEIDRVGIHDSFFDLGGNSLVAIRLMSAISEKWGVELPLRDLFEGPTPAELAATVSTLLRSESLDDLRQRRGVNLEIAARLPADVRPAGEVKAPLTPPADILLTGATGFLGAWLLRDLLQAGSATLHCLVRASTRAEGRERLVASLRARDIWKPQLEERIQPVLGDLARPRLGLAREEFQALAERIDVIYHSGASTSFFLPYDSLAPVNVAGTMEILRLACLGRGTPVHHVSTIGVFDTLQAPPVSVIDEDTDLDEFTQLSSGYAQTKHVAERLVRVAAERGLPVTIYRPGRIVGDSLAGSTSAGDFASRLLAGCLELECAPALAADMDLTPVDYVSAAIVELSGREASRGQTWHLVNPAPLSQAALVSALQEHGWRLRVLPQEEWQGLLEKQVAPHPGHPLYPLLPLLMEARPAPGQAPDLACTRTVAALAGTEIHCPPGDAALLGRWIAGLGGAT